MEIAPPGPIDTLVRLLLLILFGAMLFFGVSREVGPPGVAPGPTEGGMRAMTVIDQVEVIVLESFPMQLRLHVSGYQPDGCELPVMVEQRREGNAVYVEIFRDLPPDMICPEIIVKYEDTIALEGGFESGAYTINVNGFVVTVEL